MDKKDKHELPVKTSNFVYFVNTIRIQYQWQRLMSLQIMQFFTFSMLLSVFFSSKSSCYIISYCLITKTKIKSMLIFIKLLKLVLVKQL